MSSLHSKSTGAFLKPCPHGGGKAPHHVCDDCVDALRTSLKERTEEWSQLGQAFIESQNEGAELMRERDELRARAERAEGKFGHPHMLDRELLRKARSQVARLREALAVTLTYVEVYDDGDNPVAQKTCAAARAVLEETK